MSLGFQDVEDPRFLDIRQPNVERFSAGRLYPQDITLVHIYVSGLVEIRAIVRPEGLNQLKTTPFEIEPATFLLVAQCLKQLRHHVTSCF
jgi:hypothetical protein